VRVSATYGPRPHLNLPPRGPAGSAVNALRQRIECRRVYLEAPVVLALTAILDSVLSIAGLVGKGLELLQGHEQRDQVLDALRQVQAELHQLHEAGLSQGRRATLAPEQLQELLDVAGALLERTGELVRTLGANLPATPERPA
jgi:hypothetical protein